MTHNEVQNEGERLLPRAGYLAMLFFTGTRDSLCDLDLLRGVLGRLEGPWALEVIDKGDHSFNVLKSTGKSRDEVYADIIHRAVEWLDFK